MFPRTVLLLALSSLALAAELAGARLGTPVSGPPVAASDLIGKVVIFEYWGVNCPPCVANIPHISELAGLADRDRLVVIANHCQSPGRTLEVWHAKGGTDAVSVVEGGELTNANVSGIPRVFVFDHTGAQVYDGHPGELTPTLVTKWLDAAPGPLVPVGNYTACAAEAKALKAPTATVAPVLKSLRVKAAAAKEPAATEARQILDGVTAFATKRQESIAADRSSDPMAAQRTLTRALTLFKGDELGKPFEALAKELKADKAFQTEVKAGDLLAQLRAAGRKLGAGSEDLPASKKTAINDVVKELLTLNRKFPGTQAAKQALELAQEWAGPGQIPPMDK